MQSWVNILNATLGRGCNVFVCEKYVIIQEVKKWGGKVVKNTLITKNADKSPLNAGESF